MQHIMKEENLHENLVLHVTAVASMIVSGIGERKCRRTAPLLVDENSGSSTTPVALACPICSKALKAWRSDECAVYIRS